MLAVVAAAGEARGDLPFDQIGYLILVFLAAIAGRALYPRLEQMWYRGRAPRRMPEYANDVEETHARLIGLYMQTAEVEMHMAWLLENVPHESFEDKILLSLRLASRTEPAILHRAEELGLYKPHFAWKAVATTLDDSRMDADHRCPKNAAQPAYVIPFPRPGTLPKLGPPVSTAPSQPPGPVTIPSPSSAEASSGSVPAAIWREVQREFASPAQPLLPAPLGSPSPEAPAPTRRSFMVLDGGRLRPAVMKIGGAD